MLPEYTPTLQDYPPSIFSLNCDGVLRGRLETSSGCWERHAEQRPPRFVDVRFRQRDAGVQPAVLLGEVRHDCLLEPFVGRRWSIGETDKWEDAMGGGCLQHAAACVRDGEEALVWFCAWGRSTVQDLLAECGADLLDGVVVCVYIGRQCLCTFQSR